jgi:hypothetical protein
MAGAAEKVTKRGSASRQHNMHHHSMAVHPIMQQQRQHEHHDPQDPRPVHPSTMQQQHQQQQEVQAAVEAVPATTASPTTANKQKESVIDNWAFMFNLLKQHFADHGPGKCKSDFFDNFKFLALLPFHHFFLQTTRFHKSSNSI